MRRDIRGAVCPVDLGDAERGHERGLRLGLVISIEQNAWSTVTIDRIRTIDTSYVTGELVDYLSRDDMAHVEHSLSRYLGLLR